MPLKRIRALTVVTMALSTNSAKAAAFMEASNFLSMDNKEAGTYLYANASYNIDDKTKVVPELLTLLTYRTEGKDSFSATHGYLRIAYNRKEIASFGDWKLGYTGRYAPPTTTKAQQAGSFGYIFNRADLSLKKSSWSLTLREGLGVHIQRNGYQVNVPVAEAKGNELVTNNFEAIATKSLGEEVTLSSYFLLINGIVGPRPGGQEGTTWNNSLWQEHEVRYIPKDFGRHEFALSVFHISDLSPGADFKFFSNTATYNLKVAKSF